MPVLKWESPFVTVALTIHVQVRRSDFVSVWIAVRRATKVKANEDNDLATTILIRALSQI